MLPVGSIVASFLAEDDFKHEMRAIARDQVWQLSDGRPIENGRLQEIVRNNPIYKELNPNNNATLPDLRGVFLRGLQLGRENDKRSDPEGHDRKVGGFQGDAFASHSHPLSPTYPNSPYAPDLDAGRRTLGSIGWQGYPEAVSDNVGGSETRPRNVAVNYYVRIA